MNEEIVIKLGEVSEETKGCEGGLIEGQLVPQKHDEITPEDCE